ncbi:hypothetical protein P3S67_022109 [Capsicum chacoense]
MDTQSSKGTMVIREEGTSIGDEIFEIRENERQWIHSLEKRRGDIGSLHKPKIQKVAKKFREIESNVRCYEPLVVSIGPFHHGKPELQLMEKHKELLALQFADQDISIDELYKKVKNIMPSVRECYDDELIKKYSHEEFAQMMLLDGCFILQYFHCIVTGNYKELKMKSHDIAFIRRDLFLLENQLPFEVLQVLMNFMSFLGKICGEEGPPFTKQESMKNWLPAHLLELLKTHLIDPNAFSEGGCYLRGEWCPYRSAMELRRAGICFMPGKSRRLSDIKFASFHCSAHLTLPRITIDDSTKAEFLNLVAYEACPDTPDDFAITSYICFMRSLIDNAEDVKELRSKDILLNFFGTDEEVANLFKEIALNLVPNPHAFVDVKYKIQKQCSSRRKAWFAELKNTHFASNDR